MLETWIFLYISGNGVLQTTKFNSEPQCEQVKQWVMTHAPISARMECEKLAPSIKERAADFSKKITKKLEEKANERKVEAND